MPPTMTRKEQADWADKLIKLKTAWKRNDLAREKEYQKTKKPDADADLDPDLGKVFHYDKECQQLDECYDHFLKTKVVTKFDMNNMKARMEIDKALWKSWIVEETERQNRIKEAYTKVGKESPFVALPTEEQAQAPQVKRVVKPNSTPKAAPESPQKKKKSVRFVLPGDPDDPWQQEAPPSQARTAAMVEHAAETNKAWAEIVAAMEHGEGKAITAEAI